MELQKIKIRGRKSPLFLSNHALFFSIFFIIGFNFAAEAALSISISASPSAFTINSAVAGQNPSSVSNTSTTYSIATDTLVRSINGKISATMPTNVTLKVQLQAPITGASSLGLVTMTTAAANLVTGIPTNSVASSKTITYQLSATIAAAQTTNNSRILTLTIQ